jgi:hypothetical protein
MITDSGNIGVQIFSSRFSSLELLSHWKPSNPVVTSCARNPLSMRLFALTAAIRCGKMAAWLNSRIAFERSEYMIRKGVNGAVTQTGACDMSLRFSKLYGPPSVVGEV